MYRLAGSEISANLFTVGDDDNGWYDSPGAAREAAKPAAKQPAVKKHVKNSNTGNK